MNTFLQHARDDGELPTRSWPEVKAHIERTGGTPFMVEIARQTWNRFVKAYKKNPEPHLAPGFEDDVEELL